MKIKAYDNEPFERLLRRFKRAVDKSGVLQDLRDKEFYTKPNVERKLEKSAAVKRTQKRIRSQQLPKKLY